MICRFSAFPDSRFWDSEFRIPNSVWRMGILEYRTMRLGAAGAHMGFAWAGCNGV